MGIQLAHTAAASPAEMVTPAFAAMAAFRSAAMKPVEVRLDVAAVNIERRCASLLGQRGEVLEQKGLAHSAWPKHM